MHQHHTWTHGTQAFLPISSYAEAACGFLTYIHTYLNMISSVKKSLSIRSVICFSNAAKTFAALCCCCSFAAAAAAADGAFLLAVPGNGADDDEPGVLLGPPRLSIV